MCAAPMEMTVADGQRTDGDALAAWAEGLAGRRDEMLGRGRLRFAFYGRVSTEDWQDPESSRARQRERARGAGPRSRDQRGGAFRRRSAGRVMP